MKKIPTLFNREFLNHKIVNITDEIMPGCEEAFLHGDATVKFDGACCAIIDGVFYKRYDAKKGKTPPEGAIPCCDPDPITGHWPHWVRVDPESPSDRWFMTAYYNLCERQGFIFDGTYEAIGPHFNGNPHQLISDTLVIHGDAMIANLPRTFEDVKYYLKHHIIEGIVFWYDDEPVCKIKRRDFGFPWPVKEETNDTSETA